MLHSGGYSLSGAAGDGVLTQITYGPNQYVFTNTAKTKVTVAAEAKKAKVKKAQQDQVQRQGHAGRLRARRSPSR